MNVFQENNDLKAKLAKKIEPEPVEPTFFDDTEFLLFDFLKEMLTVAKRYRQFVFANIDGIKFSKYVSQFGIVPEGLPTLFASEEKRSLNLE
jgi:hypothetical protein